MIESAGDYFAFAEINCGGILNHCSTSTISPNDTTRGTGKCPASFRLNRDRVLGEGSDASKRACVSHCAVIDQGEV